MKPETFNSVHADINYPHLWLILPLCKKGVAVLIAISIHHGVSGQNRYKKGGRREKEQGFS